MNAIPNDSRDRRAQTKRGRPHVFAKMSIKPLSDRCIMVLEELVFRAIERRLRSAEEAGCRTKVTAAALLVMDEIVGRYLSVSNYHAKNKRDAIAKSVAYLYTHRRIRRANRRSAWRSYFGEKLTNDMLYEYFQCKHPGPFPLGPIIQRYRHGSLGKNAQARTPRFRRYVISRGGAIIWL